MTPILKFLLLFVSFTLVVVNDKLVNAKVPDFVINGWRKIQAPRKFEYYVHTTLHLWEGQQFYMLDEDIDEQINWCSEAANRFLSRFFETVEVNYVAPFPKDAKHRKTILFKEDPHFSPKSVDCLLCVAECTLEDAEQSEETENKTTQFVEMKIEVPFYATRIFRDDVGTFRSFALAGDVDPEYLDGSYFLDSLEENEEETHASKYAIYVVADLGEWTDDNYHSNRAPPEDYIEL